MNQKLKALRYVITPICNAYVPKITTLKLGYNPRDDSQAEQQCSQLDARGQAEQSEGPSHQLGEGAPLNQTNTRACGDNCQAEQQCSRRDANSVGQDGQNCTQPDERGQAEQSSTTNISSSSSNTHSTRQSPTKPGAVARYVITPVSNIYVAKNNQLQIMKPPQR